MAGESLPGRLVPKSQDKSRLLCEWFHQLAPEPVASDTTPLLVVRFNTFECGGVAIGMDYQLSLSLKLELRLAELDLLIYNTVQVSRDIVLTPRKSNGPGDDNHFTMKRLVFSAEAISNLRAIIYSASVVHDSESLKNKPTRHEAVIAFIWMCLIRMNKARHGRLRRSLLSIAVSMLKKTTLPIPENSWGNHCIGYHAKASNGDEIVSLVDNRNEVVFKGREEPDTDSYNSSSLCRFPLYEADHGWGKPCWVTMPMNQKLRNVIFLMDTFHEQDPEIIPFL
ncbi:hypothetical protein Tsubulata_020976, partial [Turnera subulata]